MKGILKTASAVALVAQASSAAAQDAQFNLRCTGTTTTSSNAGTTTEAYETVFRFDLTAGKWCENQCLAIFDLAGVQPTQITLTDEKEESISESSFLSNFINRTTGEHHVFSGMKMRSVGIMVNIRSKGTCEREAFTGLTSTAPTKF